MNSAGNKGVHHYAWLSFISNCFYFLFGFLLTVFLIYFYFNCVFLSETHSSGASKTRNIKSPGTGVMGYDSPDIGTEKQGGKNPHKNLSSA